MAPRRRYEDLSAHERVAQAEAAEFRLFHGDADDLLAETCPICKPMACDDPDNHLGVPERYTPLKNRGCHCGADFDGRDCMCFESYDG